MRQGMMTCLVVLVIALGGGGCDLDDLDLTEPSQTRWVNLTGVVTDATTSLPIEGAVVRAHSSPEPPLTAQTDSTGRYGMGIIIRPSLRYQGSSCGNWSISVSADGYAAIDGWLSELTSCADDDASADFQMTPLNR
jgi:hypothetical protein